MKGVLSCIAKCNKDHIKRKLWTDFIHFCWKILNKILSTSIIKEPLMKKWRLFYKFQNNLVLGKLLIKLIFNRPMKTKYMLLPINEVEVFDKDQYSR